MMHVRVSEVWHMDGFKIRAEDCREVWRMSRTDPYWMLCHAIENCESWTVFDGDNPVAFFGVRQISQMSDVYEIYMLSGYGVDSNIQEFARRSRKFVRGLMRKYGSLFNYVDAEYTRCIKWLRFVGFTVSDKPVKINGFDFLEFRGGI